MNRRLNTAALAATAVLALASAWPASAASAAVQTAPTLTSPSQTALEGAYVDETGSAIVVRSTDGRLKLTSGPVTFTLVAVSDGRFRAEERDLEFVFAGDTVTIFEQGRQVAKAVRGSPTPQAVAFQGDGLLNWLDQNAASMLERYKVPAVAVAYIDQGQVAWTRVYGERRRGEPAALDTLFNVASLTKPIAAEVLLRLASSGQIDLDAPMAPTWVDPDLADDTRAQRLTVRMALNHRTGLPNWRTETANVLRFVSDPGAAFHYSGEAYTYAARYAERTVGEPFEQLADRLVFAPLGMQDTAFTVQPSFKTRAAYPHDGQEHELWPVLRLDFSAACCLYATVGDYGRFLVGVMNDTALSPEMAAARFDISDDARSDMCGGATGLAVDICPPRIGWGMGWMVFGFENETVITHTGINDGERSAAFFVPERRTGMVILTNGAGGTKLIRDITAAAYDNPGYNRIVASFVR